MTKPEFSYHIIKELDGAEVFWWPISGFGNYCTDELQARKNYEEQVRDDPQGSYKLVQYKAVYKGKNVVGITGTAINLAKSTAN